MAARNPRPTRRELYYRAAQQRALAKAEMNAARVDGLDLSPYLREVAEAEAEVQRYERRPRRWWPL
jgi:hypothetical protein